MKIIRNDRLIARNGKIGEYTSIAGMVSLVVGMYFGVSGLLKPESITTQREVLLLGAMALGIVGAQIGNYFGARFGRSPRPDEKIDAALKGLHSEFHIYHHCGPAPHMLIGPAGVWAIIPYSQRGRIEFLHGRWRLHGGGFMQSYLRIFGQEGIGRPELEAQSQTASIEKFFAKRLDAADRPEVRAVLVFTSDDVELDAGESPIPAMPVKRLKEFMREAARQRVLNSDQIDRLVEISGN